MYICRYIVCILNFAGCSMEALYVTYTSKRKYNLPRTIRISFPTNHSLLGNYQHRQVPYGPRNFQQGISQCVLLIHLNWVYLKIKTFLINVYLHILIVYGHRKFPHNYEKQYWIILYITVHFDGVLGHVFLKGFHPVTPMFVTELCYEFEAVT
jgi:hypothetical protein